MNWLLAIVADIPEVEAFITQLEASLKALPPVAVRTPNDYVALFNSLDGPAVALVTTILAQLKTAAPAAPTAPAK